MLESHWNADLQLFRTITYFWGQLRQPLRSKKMKLKRSKPLYLSACRGRLVETCSWENTYQDQEIHISCFPIGAVNHLYIMYQSCKRKQNPSRIRNASMWRSSGQYIGKSSLQIQKGVLIFCKVKNLFCIWPLVRRRLVSILEYGSMPPITI